MDIYILSTRKQRLTSEGIEREHKNIAVDGNKVQTRFDPGSNN